MRKIHCP